ncbi:MAG: helix-turn-helix domain-containing protein [Acidimicrobiia bacterium]
MSGGDLWTQSGAVREQALADAGLLHPDPAGVSSPLFVGPESFFLAADKVQVKYEMLRARVVDGLSATAAARIHGYSRAAFYLVEAAFDTGGVAGLLDDRRGPKGPAKLTEEILAFLVAEGGRPASVLAAEVEARFGVSLHRRTVERARRG